jgi:hypothetical protein
MTFKTILCTKKQVILHLNKITECLKMTTFKIVFTFDVFVSAETTCTARWHAFYIRNRHISVLLNFQSSGFYFWNVNRTPTWHLSKMSKVAFKDVSTKNSEPTYWTILFVMLKIYFIYKILHTKTYTRMIICIQFTCSMMEQWSQQPNMRWSREWRMTSSIKCFQQPQI